MSSIKYSYKLNKPKKIVNEKSGYVSKQETTPDRPITIYYGTRKVLDVYNTVDVGAKSFAKAVVTLLNSNNYNF